MKFLFLMLVAGLLSLAVVACSDDEDDPTEELEVTPAGPEVTTGGAPGTIVSVELGEYSIQTNTNTAQPGQVTFAINNDGDLAHQFIVIDTELAAEDLPLNQDTGQVDLDAEELNVTVAHEAIESGNDFNLAASLEAGHYVFICNLTGHYERGMRYNFIVGTGDATGGAPTGGSQ